MLCINATYAVLRRLSDVCHIRVLCRNGYRYGHSYYGMRTENCNQDFEWYTICSDLVRPLTQISRSRHYLR